MEAQMALNTWTYIDFSSLYIYLYIFITVKICFSLLQYTCLTPLSSWEEKKNQTKTVSLQSHLICVCHKIQTEQAMCEIRVRPFQDRTAKRQAKSLRGSRPTCQMVVLDSPGGRDWPYPAGWSLKTRKTKKKRKRGREGKGGEVVKQ